MPALTERAGRTSTLLVAGLLLAGQAAPAAAQATVSRLVEVIDASAADRNVEVLVQFACGARYAGHTPPQAGKAVSVRLRLGTDCGQAPAGRWPSERPQITGNSNLLKAAWLDETLPGEVAVTLAFDKPQTFVLVPTADGRGIRVRVLDALPGRKASIKVSEPTEPLAGYAINLDSAREPISPEVLDAAARTLGLPTYASSIELQGTTWYRLRAGPIALRRDAERLLLLAQKSYPRAWLAINDEATTTTADEAPVPPASGPSGPTDPPMLDLERRAVLDQARGALAARDYPRAVELLTKLTRQPEYAGRAQAQELLGLARERAGQLAHAKAEYSEYLRRYPDGDAAARIRARLRSLNAAGRKGRGGTRDGEDGEDAGWLLAGGASQMYRFERVSLTAADSSIKFDSQNILFTDGDFQARLHGERYDMLARVAAGYGKDLLPDGPGDQTRVSAAFFELNDRELGVAARLGRQSRNSGGLLGTFDGLNAAWQASKWLSLSTTIGFPVESTHDAPSTDRRFIGVAAGFGPFDDSWDLSAFAVAQQYSGEMDRRAIGMEARYFVPGRTLVGLVDYDVAYGTLNSAILMGSIQLPARWTFGFNADHRHSPVLTTRNALIGQPVQTMEELLGMYSSAEIQQLAEDRTPLSDVFSVSLARPVSERLQLSFDVYASKTAATPASGGVAATPEGPLDKTFQLQLMANGLAWPDDVFVFAARYQDNEAQTLQSLGVWTRLPLGSTWRIGPRLRVDRRETHNDLGTEMIYVPSLRVDYQRGAAWLEFECGAELGQRQIPTESERSKRFYAGLGYRIAF